MTPLLGLGGPLNMTLLAFILVPIAIGMGIYTLAQMRIVFVMPKEGTAVAIMRGEALDHIIMVWTGHRLNDPRRKWYNPALPTWEVIKMPQPGIRYSNYDNNASWFLQLLERYGIFYYGLWPFKKVYEYTFDWTEFRLDDKNVQVPYHRTERTWFVYVATFVYWLRLIGAEDRNRMPLDLDYSLSVGVTNPQKALFNIEDWLGRITADAHQAARIYVGGRVFDEIIRERGAGVESEFVTALESLNENLLSEPGREGCVDRLGVTLRAIALQEVTLSGTSKAELARATTAPVVARLDAEATVAKARGDRDATILRAEGDALATALAAGAEAKAIDVTYRRVIEYGQDGLTIRQLQALERAGKAGSATIWANNPVAAALATFAPKPERNPQPPVQPPTAD